MSTEGVGGAGGSNGPSGAGSVGAAESASAANATDSADVDAAMSDVSDAEVAGAAASVTEAEDGFEAAEDAAEAKEAEEAGLCIGTRTECEQKKADEMSEEEAIEALDGSFFHEPERLDASQVKGLEALSEAPHLSQRTRDAIKGFLEDHRNFTDRLKMDPNLGRPDAPRHIPDPNENII